MSCETPPTDRPGSLIPHPGGSLAGATGPEPSDAPGGLNAKKNSPRASSITRAGKYKLLKIELRRLPDGPGCPGCPWIPLDTHGYPRIAPDTLGCPGCPGCANYHLASPSAHPAALGGSRRLPEALDALDALGWIPLDTPGYPRIPSDALDALDVLIIKSGQPISPSGCPRRLPEAKMTKNIARAAASQELESRPKIAQNRAPEAPGCPGCLGCPWIPLDTLI